MQVTVPNAAPAAATFSRASAATYIEESGILRYSSAGNPRYYNGALILEASAINLLTYSDDFRNTAEAGATRPWVQYDDTGNAVAVVQQTTTTPAGSSASVSKLTANTTGSVVRQISQNFTAADDALVVGSIMVKAAEVTRLLVKITTKSWTAPYAIFSVSTGAVLGSDAAGDSNFLTGYQSLAGGWIRLWIRASVQSGGGTPSFAVVLNKTSAAEYSGAIGDGLFLFGAQVEVGAGATSYIPTTTATATRQADTLTDGYLVAESRSLVGLGIQKMAEDGSVSAWSAATAYAVDDEAYRATTHRVYRRLVAGTTATPPEDDGVNWRDVRATTSWAALALTEDSQTVATYDVYFTVSLGAESVDTLVMSGIHAASGSVVVSTNAGVELYRYTQTFDASVVPLGAPKGANWRAQFPAPLSDCLIHVRLRPQTIGVGLAFLCWGLGYTFGGTLTGARIGITDYSRRETDEFGTTTLVKRGYAKRMSGTVLLRREELADVLTLLSDLRATPAFWVPSSDSELAPLTVYGWCKDFGISVDYARHALCQIEIEGLL